MLKPRGTGPFVLKPPTFIHFGRLPQLYQKPFPNPPFRARSRPGSSRSTFGGNTGPFVLMPEGTRPFVLIPRGTGPFVLMTPYHQESRTVGHKRKKLRTVWHKHKKSRAVWHGREKSRTAWHKHEKSRTIWWLWSPGAACNMTCCLGAEGAEPRE